jgi:hypothetical protein
MMNILTSLFMIFRLLARAEPPVFLLCSLCLFPCCGSLAQSAHPLVEQELNRLTLWLQQEIDQKGYVDDSILAQKNAGILKLQDSLSKVVTHQLGSDTVLSGKKITRTLLSGSGLRVPDNVRWKLIGVYVKAEQGGYRVVVQSVKYKSVYHSGEVLTMPAMSSEAALLGEDGTSMTYEVEFIEFPSEAR